MEQHGKAMLKGYEQDKQRQKNIAANRSL